MVKANRKKNIIIIAFVLAAIITTFVVLYANANPSVVQYRKQLNLGTQYLSELNYEQAVACFTKALELKPNDATVRDRLVDAYLGWSDSVMAEGDWERALTILSEGFEKTEREELLKRQNEIGIPPSFVDGIYHHGYRYCEYGETSRSYLEEIIGQANAEEYEKICCETLNPERTKSLLDEIHELDEDYGSAYFIYNGYKIHILFFYMGSEQWYILPLEDKEGYYFEWEHDNDNSYSFEYAHAECKNGMYNGAYYGLVYRGTYDNSYFRQSEFRGRIVNGLRDGAWELQETFKDDSDSLVSEYDMGHPFAREVEPRENGENNYMYRWSVDANGQPDGKSGSGVVYTPEEYETFREGVPPVVSYHIQEIEGGYRVYDY